jgi:hypothetical protein
VTEVEARAWINGGYQGLLWPKFQALVRERKWYNEGSCFNARVRDSVVNDIQGRMTQVAKLRAGADYEPDSG